MYLFPEALLKSKHKILKWSFLPQYIIDFLLCMYVATNIQFVHALARNKIKSCFNLYMGILAMETRSTWSLVIDLFFHTKFESFPLQR